MGSGTMDLVNRKVLVVGAARSGLAAARKLVSLGARVTLTDSKGEQALKEAREALSDLAVDWETGVNRPETVEGMDLVVVSPGVPPTIPVLTRARDLEVEVIGEVELAWRLDPRDMVAVTGTNGKSTTVSLIGAMLQASGLRAKVCGNIGNPLIEVVETTDWLVVELSSFQLEGVTTFEPKIAVLLNITDDHRDRYSSFEEYARAKERILTLVSPGGHRVVNGEDALVLAMAIPLEGAALCTFGADQGWDVHLEGSHLVRWDHGQREVYSTQRMLIKGRHNLENAMAAVAAARLAGASPQGVQAALDSFPGLSHRMEFVAQREGVSFINDSKGTNVGAVIKSLMSFDQPVVLLAGGKDKGSDYTPLIPVLRERARGLVLFGQAKDAMYEALKDAVPLWRVDNLDQALHRAILVAKRGDVVLLSPACSSFDQFRDFEDRGRAFQALVLALGGGEK